MLKRTLAALLALLMFISCGLAEAGLTPADADKTTATVEPVAKEPDTAGKTPWAIENLIQLLAKQLMGQDYTLDIVTDYDSQTVRVGSNDGETIQIEIDGDEISPINILLDGKTVSTPDGKETYTYSEALNLLLFGIDGENAASEILSLPDIFDEHDLDFLKTVGKLAYYELMNVGAIPVVKRVRSDTYFTLSLTSNLIETAVLRFVERLLDHQVEIDSLLSRTNPLLRKLIPELYEEFDPETGVYTEREAYTCAELQTLFESWMTRQLTGRQWIDIPEMHLDINGLFGDDGWRLDASYFMPEGNISVWLELNGDESGSFDGMLEYCTRDYSRTSGQHEVQSFRFNIDCTVMGNCISMRVRPETPLSDFTGLRINYAWDFSGSVINVVTDLLDFRMELSRELTNISVAMQEFLLEVQLTNFDGIPQGFLIFRDYWDGVYLKLNDPK